MNKNKPFLGIFTQALALTLLSQTGLGLLNHAMASGKPVAERYFGTTYLSKNKDEILDAIDQRQEEIENALEQIDKSQSITQGKDGNKLWLVPTAALGTLGAASGILSLLAFGDSAYESGLAIVEHFRTREDLTQEFAKDGKRYHGAEDKSLWRGLKKDNMAMENKKLLGDLRAYSRPAVYIGIPALALAALASYGAYETYQHAFTQNVEVTWEERNELKRALELAYADLEQAETILEKSN